jgi:hypothetical protein
MKLSKYFVFISLISAGFVACKEDTKEGTLTLHFKPTYDQATLPTFSTVAFDPPQQLQFSHMSMMVSDILLYDQSSEKDLDDIELVDLSFDNLQDATSGYTVSYQHVPAGSYKGIRFGIGVPPDMNAKKPADFPSSSPLSKTGYYWLAWNSYIFMKTEGRLDTLGNGAFDMGYALHTGSDALYRTLDGPVPLVIEDGKETNLTIAIDYKKLLQGVDIKSHPQNHTPQDTSELVKIVNNLGTSVTLIL